jgi:hypothetical protein
MAKKISRQRAWQLARRKQGLCIGCGAEPLLTKNHGPICAEKQREAMRRATNAKTRYQNSLSYQKPQGS